MDMSPEVPDLVAQAIRAEMEANEAYTELADQVDNFVLKDKFKYLAKEEAHHRAILERLFIESFPGTTLVIPQSSGAPRPNVRLSPENTLSDVLASAMEAEKAAEAFYMDLAKRFDDENRRDLLEYLGNIEAGHYHFLKIEHGMALRFEEYDQHFDMMHVGP